MIRRIAADPTCMLYREAGQFKTPTKRTRRSSRSARTGSRFAVMLVLAFVVVPLVASPYVFSAILIPFLILSLAALGLNILTGYAGQLSLGHRGVHGGGRVRVVQLRAAHAGHAASCVAFALAAVCRARCVGILFGLPSLRIRGFYLAVATLAAQFFIVWCLTKVGWFTNYSASGVITAQPMRHLRLSLRHAGGEVPARAGDRARCWRSPRRTWRAATSAARGWRCATWTSPPR